MLPTLRSASFLLLALAGCASSPPPPAPAAPANAIPTALAAAATPSPTPPEATAAPTVLTPDQQARDAALEPKAMAFLEAYANGAPLLTRTSLVAFLSTRDGLPQLYTFDAKQPAALPKHLPTPKEQVRSPVLTPDDRAVLFLSDVGNDNNFHVFRAELDGSKVTDLTPGETLHRNRPAVARTKPLFAFSAHAAASEKTRAFLQSTELTGGAPAAPREFYADDRGGFLQDLSPDGTRALFVRENGDEDDVVFEVEVATGKATRIFPAEAAKAGAGAVYSAKGDRILVSTQSEGHASELLAFDRATRKLAARYEESALPTASIEDVSVARSGDALALEIDAGNHTELRLLDARSLKPLRPVTAPLGALTLGASSPDGKRFSLTISRPDAPSEIATLDLKTGAITPLRADERPGLASMPALKASIESVTATDGLKVPVNLYLPEQASGKLPTILLVHGGPSGSSEMRFNPDVRFFTALGYAIVEPNIRGSSGFGVAYQNADNKEKRGDALKDVETIHAWAAAQPWCDPSRTIIMGQSYGGYMTLLALARQPKLWRAGVDLSGMSDLRTMEKLEDQSIRVYDETEFGVLGKEDDLLFEWSPLKHVGDVVAPLFVYQGKNDPITPQNEADQMVKALRQRRVPVEYMLLDDEGHGIVRRANRAVFLARVARFLGDHAGPGATPGTPGAAGSSP